MTGGARLSYRSGMPRDLAPNQRFIEGYLPYLLARASHSVSAEFHHRLKGRGVSVAEWRVLGSLSGASAETVGALADACLMQQPTMTKLLGRMVREGLVERLPDPGDRRIVRVGLTRRGADMAAELTAVALAHEDAVTATMPSGDAMALRSLLTGLIGRQEGG